MEGSTKARVALVIALTATAGLAGCKGVSVDRIGSIRSGNHLRLKRDLVLSHYTPNAGTIGVHEPGFIEAQGCYGLNGPISPCLPADRRELNCQLAFVATEAMTVPAEIILEITEVQAASYPEKQEYWPVPVWHSGAHVELQKSDARLLRSGVHCYGGDSRVSILSQDEVSLLLQGMGLELVEPWEAAPLPALETN